MNKVLDINHEMAIISQPIDMANDEFANLFSKRGHEEKAMLSFIVPFENNENSPAKLISARQPFLNVFQVSMASCLAIFAFVGGLHLSGVVDTTSLTREGFEPPKNNTPLPIAPRVKQTVIGQTKTDYTGVRVDSQLEQPLPKPIAVPLANIVAAAYGGGLDDQENDFLITEVYDVKSVHAESDLTWLGSILSIFETVFDEPQVFTETSFAKLIKSTFTLPFMGRGFLSSGDDGLVEPQNTRAKCGEPYQVKQGQTLAMISQEIFGTTTRWRQLYYVNRHMIGSSASYLVTGQVLKVQCEKIKIAVKNKVRTKKRSRRFVTRLKIKKSHGNRLITITKVRRRK